MKRKPLLFLLCGIAIVLVLALSLVFSEKIKNGYSENKESVSNSESNKVGDNNQSSEENSKTTFALAHDNAIYMHVGSEVEILDSYFVTNGDASKIKAEVLSYYNSDVSGLNYDNRILTANKVDSYKLEFSLEIEENFYLKQDVIVYVVNEAKITKKENKLEVNTSYNISDLLEISETIENLNIETDEKLTYENNKFIVKSAGKSNISVSYVNESFKYIYKFSFDIYEKPIYSILINGTEISSLEANLTDEYFSFSYEIFDLNSQPAIDQEIFITIEDENVVSLDTIYSPIVSLKLNGEGTTKLTIIKLDDPNFVKTIEIKVN